MAPRGDREMQKKKKKKKKRSPSARHILKTEWFYTPCARWHVFLFSINVKKM